jgi:hypothetical protein
MKKKLLPTVLLVFFGLTVFSQQENLKEVLSVANVGYINCLELIPKGQEKDYGFNNREEFTIAKIGKPYITATLNKEFFSDTILSSKNYIAYTEEWRIPISVNGEYRTLMRVIKMNGKWEVSGLGGAVLAKELGEFEKSHQYENEYGIIFRVYQMVSDFILINKNIYPLQSAKTALLEIEKKKEMYSLSEGLLLIKQHIKH